MSSLSITVQNEAAVLGALSPEHVGQDVAHGMEQAGQILTEVARGIVGPHRWHGTLEASFRTRVTGSGFHLEAQVYSDDPAADVISHGWHGDKQPDTAGLTEWVRERLGVSAQEAPHVAYAIARKIRERGLAMQPLEIMEKVAEQAGPQFAEAIARAISEAP